MRIENGPVLWNLLETATVASVTNSDPQQLDHIYGFAVQATWSITSPVSGAICYLESSNDGISWCVLEDSIVNITVDDSVLYNVTDAMFNHVRLSFDLSFGEMIVSGRFNIKGV